MSLWQYVLYRNRLNLTLFTQPYILKLLKRTLRRLFMYWVSIWNREITHRLLKFLVYHTRAKKRNVYFSNYFKIASNLFYATDGYAKIRELRKEKDVAQNFIYYIFFQILTSSFFAKPFWLHIPCYKVIIIWFKNLTQDFDKTIFV